MPRKIRERVKHGGPVPRVGRKPNAAERLLGVLMSPTPAGHSGVTFPFKFRQGHKVLSVAQR